MAATAPQIGTGPPTGPAGGALAGTYPDPDFAADLASQAELDAHAADTTTVHGIADTAVLEVTTAKGTAGGYAALDDDGLVPAAQVPITAPGNRVAMLGDSLTGSLPTPEAQPPNYLPGPSLPLAHAHFLQPRLVIAGAFGVSGENSGEILARVTDITGLDPRPDWCVLLAGTNDTGDAVPAATYAANMAATCAALRAAGVRVALCKVPPVPSTTVAVGVTRRLLADRYNAWLSYFAARSGIPLIDPLPDVMDETTGGWLPAYDSGDSIHPNHAGAKVLGQAIADAFEALVDPWEPPFPTHAESGHTANLVPNALFLDDSNADGVPDSWTKSGTHTSSIIATPGDPVVGSSLRLLTVDTGFTQITAPMGAGAWAAGDRLAVCARFKNNGAAAGGNLGLTFTGASSFAYRLAATIPVDGAWRSAYAEFIVPAGTTTGQVYLNANGTTGLDVEIAQVGVYNLTALGVA